MALLLALAVDRWVDRFDAWLDGRLSAGTWSRADRDPDYGDLACERRVKLGLSRWG